MPLELGPDGVPTRITPWVRPLRRSYRRRMLVAMSTNDVWSWVAVVLAALAALLYLIGRPDTLRIAPALTAAAVGCIAAALLTALP